MTTAARSPTTTPQRDTPLEQVPMEWARAQILKNLYRRFDGARPDLQAKLEAAHMTRYGMPMRKVKTRDVRAIYLESPPGHGKTTIHREACRDFANDLGMKFLENVTLNQMQKGMVDENCFVFSTVNLGGATSKHEIGGLMAKLRIGDQEFMGHLPDWRMAAAMMGGYGYVLFDDFVTSSHQVQNACLDMLLGGSAGDMQFNIRDLQAARKTIENGQLVATITQDKINELDAVEEQAGVRGASPVHIGLAGNRGVRDGNKTFPIVTATATRIQRMDVFDTPEAFIDRAMRKHSDELGDAFYSVWIKQNPELFSIVAKPEQGILPQMPCPRSHDACMDSIADLISDHGGMAAIAADTKVQDIVVRDIERMAGTHIGRQLQMESKDAAGKPQYVQPATSLSGFYSELFLGAIPQAEAIIKKGIVDEDFIKDKYNSGANNDGQNFGYQFASALAQVAASVFAERVKKAGKKPVDQLSDPESPLSKDVRQVLNHLSQGLSFLQKSFVSFSMDRFNSRLSILCPEIYEGTTYKILPASTMKTMMYGLVKDNTKYNTRELQQTFVDAISQTNSAITAEHKQGRDATITAAVASRKDAARKALTAM